jgi:hypothetical protein
LQKQFLHAHRSTLEGIIFGPSHLWRGLHPKHFDREVASLALSSSSPNVDYRLYESIKDEVSPEFYVFCLSLGYLRHHNGPAWMASRNLPYYYSGFSPWQLEGRFLARIPLRRLRAAEKEARHYDRWGIEYDIPSGGHIFQHLHHQDSLILRHPKTRWVMAKHNLASPRQVGKNVALFKKIIRECRAQGIKVIFVSSPKYWIYNQQLNPDFALEREAFLAEVVDQETVFFLDYDSLFERDASMFLDIHHLNDAGMKRFSQTLSQAVDSLLSPGKPIR